MGVRPPRPNLSGVSDNAFSQRTVSVVIIDDHELLRGLLANALENAADLRVAGQGGDAESAVELCRRLSPDVLILDSILPGMQGPDVVELVVRASPRTKVLMLSGAMTPVALRRALKGGALGFLPKTAPFSEMLEAIRTVAEGGFVTTESGRRLVQRTLEDMSRPEATYPLTERERGVLTGIASGKSSKEVAEELGLSVFTVENHRRRIMDRTGVRSIAGLTLLAVEMSLVKPGLIARLTGRGSDQTSGAMG